MYLIKKYYFRCMYKLYDECLNNGYDVKKACKRVKSWIFKKPKKILKKLESMNNQRSIFHHCPNSRAMQNRDLMSWHASDNRDMCVDIQGSTTTTNSTNIMTTSTTKQQNYHHRISFLYSKFLVFFKCYSP